MDNNPRFPRRHLYILSSKKTIIQCILWRTGKIEKRMIWMYLTDIPHASVLNNSWVQTKCKRMLLFGNVFIHPPQTYMNCFPVCPPDLWFLCLVHLFSLFECDCVVPGSGLWRCAEAVSVQEWIYYQSIRWHSSPACFLRLSWLCIIAVTVTLRNEVIHPTLSRIMRPTRKMCLSCSVWF